MRTKIDPNQTYHIWIMILELVRYVHSFCALESSSLTQVGQYGKETVGSGDFMKEVFWSGSRRDNSKIFQSGVLFLFSIDFRGFLAGSEGRNHRLGKRPSYILHCMVIINVINSSRCTQMVDLKH